MDFRGHDPDYADAYEMPDSRYWWEIGDLDAVEYTTVRDGNVEHYRHTFRKDARPKLVTPHNGKGLAAAGGKYKVTDRGIVDTPKKRR